MEKTANEIAIDLCLKPSKSLGKKLVIALFEYFLQSRVQIPIHFDFLKKAIEEKRKFIENRSDDAPKNWKKENQMKLAFDSYDKICLMEQIIESEYVCGDPLMFLFGSTIHTAKESYQIFFPAANDSQPACINDVNSVRMVMMKVLQTELIKATYQTILPITNVFALFGRSEPIDDIANLTELRNFKLPKSCKNLSLHFRGASDEFEIFQENFKDLSLVNDQPEEIIEPAQVHWYISKTHVKGFNEMISFTN